MARLLKKAQSEVQQGTSKPNMMKKFGGKFKKAFSKKKQSLAHKSEEAYVPDVRPATPALPNSHGQPSAENKRDIAPTQVGIDGGVLVPDDASKEPGPNASPKAATTSLDGETRDAQRQASPRGSVSIPPESTEISGSENSTPTSTEVFNTDRYTLHRSNSVPASPSSPTTGASSDTLYNTPTHSDTFSSPSLTRFRQAVDEHRRLSGKCHEALAEHIKGEENEKENAEWAALIEWMKIGHRSELDILAKDHAAKVVQLQKERSEVRRSLELRNRELRATKREMRELKKSIGEAVKSQEEKQPAPDLHQADVSDTESVDEDEGGVLLAQDNAVLTNKVCDKSEKTGDAPQKFEEAEPCMRIANEGTKEVKISKKETIAEKKKLQQALRQKLIDDSTPEALLEAEAGPSAAKQKTTAIRHQNKAPLTEVKDLQDHNKALQANLVFTRDVIHNMGVEAEARDEEVKNLKAQNHFAQLEVGHCHAANACYRAAAEDDNPARTAHLDGLLKRKDEAFADLEERAAECAELLAEEKKERAIEKAHSDAEIRGMHKELAHRFKVIKGLTEGRDILKAQNDWVFQMFQGKISHDDVIEAFLRDYLVIQSDNTLLIKMIKERQCFILDAEKQLADLKAEKIINDHAAHADYLKHRQTQQSLNGLTYVNNQLNAKIEFQNDTREELREEMQGQINQQAADIQQFLESGTEDWLIRRQQAQERQIDFLNAELTTANGVANQWRIRALEQQDAFCPLNDFAEVGDWNAEETRWRLREAERQVVELQQVVREMNRERKGKGREKGKGKEKGVWEIGHDGSNWLRDRAEAERVREEFRWVE